MVHVQDDTAHRPVLRGQMAQGLSIGGPVGEAGQKVGVGHAVQVVVSGALLLQLADPLPLPEHQGAGGAEAEGEPKDRDRQWLHGSRLLSCSFTNFKGISLKSQ